MMPTFSQPRTLQQRITDALAGLRKARDDGDPAHELGAETLLNNLLERIPRR